MPRLHLGPRRDDVRAARRGAAPRPRRPGPRARRRGGCSGRRARTRRCPARATASGSRPGQEALEDRPELEHPAGPLVPGDERVRDAEPRERVARLEPARPAADDDDGVLAGRVGLLYPFHCEQPAQAPRLGLQHADRDGRVRRAGTRSTFGAGIDETAKRRRGDDVGRRRVAEEARDLAEELAAPEPSRSRSPSRMIARLAVEDDVEARARRAPCAGSAGPRGRPPRRSACAIASSCGPREAREEGEAGEALGVGAAHSSRSLAAK